MTQQSYEENRYLLESYRSARQRLYAYMKKLEARLRAAQEPSETDSLERRLLTLYGELDDTAVAIRALEDYCRVAEEAGFSSGRTSGGGAGETPAEASGDQTAAKAGQAHGARLPAGEVCVPAEDARTAQEAASSAQEDAAGTDGTPAAHAAARLRAGARREGRVCRRS